MDERIRYESKEEANARREREFLALAPGERLRWFLDSFESRSSAGPDTDRSKDNFKDNFVVEKREHALR